MTQPPQDVRPRMLSRAARAFTAGAFLAAMTACGEDVLIAVQPELAAADVDIGYVNEGLTLHVEVPAGNTVRGAPDLTFDTEATQFSGSHAPFFKVASFPEAIAAETEEPLVIEFTPPPGKLAAASDTAAYTADLTLVSSARNDPVTITVKATATRSGVELYGDDEGRPLEETPDGFALAFGAVEAASPATAQFKIISRGSGPLHVRNVSFAEEAAGLAVEVDGMASGCDSVTPTYPEAYACGLKLAPDKQDPEGSALAKETTASLRCNSDIVGPVSGTLRVETDDPNQPIIEITVTCDIIASTAGCEDNSDCPPEFPYCDAESGRCLECQGDAQCPPDQPFCEDGACVQCRSDKDCPAGQVCVNNQCVECDSDDDCKDPGKPRCNVAENICEPEDEPECPEAAPEITAIRKGSARAGEPNGAGVPAQLVLGPGTPESYAGPFRWYFQTSGPDAIPQDSGAGFDRRKGRSSSKLRNPLLDLDLPGTYTIFLDAEKRWNDQTAICTSKLVINAYADQKIHVVLLWSKVGADLDLHLINTGSGDGADRVIWSIPCDAHWRNRSPDWGDPHRDDADRQQCIEVQGLGQPTPAEQEILDACNAFCPCVAWWTREANTLSEQELAQRDECPPDLKSPTEAQIKACGDDPRLAIDANHQYPPCAGLPQEEGGPTGDWVPFGDLCADQAGLCPAYLTNHPEFTAGQAEAVTNLCSADVGPEVMGVPEPRPGLYLIQVHYFAGVGSTAPRVRVYLDGVKADGGGTGGDFEPPLDAVAGIPQLLRPNDLWTVGFIDWREGAPPRIVAASAVTAGEEQKNGLTCELPQ